jgi:hypothetical protein
MPLPSISEYLYIYLDANTIGHSLEADDKPDPSRPNCLFSFNVNVKEEIKNDMDMDIIVIVARTTI